MDHYSAFSENTRLFVCKCPRQESNLVYELRGLACESGTLQGHVVGQYLAEESNRAWLGFPYTHPLAESDLDPAQITVTSFALHPAEYEPTAADYENYRAATASRTQERTAPPEQHARKRGRIREYFGF